MRWIHRPGHGIPFSELIANGACLKRHGYVPGYHDPSVTCHFLAAVGSQGPESWR